ncbi:Stk1 family PASTA domain-containing Ser/Thr kinase [Gulosibacter sp. ACHW.36C]|uniref:non-specific serine/threonine protein kinase n=2 Tax=Gulosibacter TaxID=256818 RepID=A0ABY4MVS7_9MICO|nr:Stk1 family PASTA domain-containing Ser/Thr kinase [Gulosibacter sediminis]UQN13904.1 Stk1 family PASTA domain-containing Ser/Thr kinase [Gulosibacter sediminis]
MSPVNPDTVIGRLVDGRYQVRSLIARGGMATVYVATDLRLDRRVAIKIMHEHLAADESFRDRFIREAQSAARLAHPNLVNVYDQGDDEGLAYIVMEYVPGITLRDLLHDHHRLTVEQTIDIMDAVLAGLQVAHRQGIIHRDIKPENVLLADDGRIKLSDFGLARAVTNNTASGSVLLGTIAYLAPELVTKGLADVRSDIYSAGIMMYEMLVGEQPYRGDEPVNIAYRHANDSVPPPSEAQPSVPGVLDDLVVWATERDAEDRPADAGAMLAALRQAERDIATGGGATVPLETAIQNFAENDAHLLAVSDNDSMPNSVMQPTGPVEAVDAAAMAPAVEGGAPAARRLQRLNGQKRRAGVLAFFVVLFMALAAAGLGWYQGIGPGSYGSTPDVVAKTQADAEATIVASGFTVGEVTEDNSLDVPQGTVISMSPEPDTKLAPDSPIDLVVSAGPRILTVPALEGLSTADAEQAITDAGFVVDAETHVTEFSGSIEADHVIRGTTETGETLPQEMAEQQTIRLVVSAGSVPEVTGMGQGEAEQALADAGLTSAVVDSQYSSTVPAGVVLSQENTADPMVPGSTVNLVVSLGPDLVEVPDVTGKPAKDAIAELEGAGFTVDHSIPSVLLDDATVSSQTPGGGEEVERGSSVKITATYEF